MTDQETSAAEALRLEVDKANARMRHFRAVAASVLADAEKVLAEVWRDAEDPRTPDEILDGAPEPREGMPAGGWCEFREKLLLLQQLLAQAKRFCDGSIS